MKDDLDLSPLQQLPTRLYNAGTRGVGDEMWDEIN